MLSQSGAWVTPNIAGMFYILAAIIVSCIIIQRFFTKKHET